MIFTTKKIKIVSRIENKMTSPNSKLLTAAGFDAAAAGISVETTVSIALSDRILSFSYRRSDIRHAGNILV